MQKIFKKRGGFTLVEVLVVVVIIAILAAIAVPIYLNYVESARASEAQEAIGNIIAAAKVYYAQKGSWPTTINAMPQLSLDQVVRNRWTFTIIAGGSGIRQVNAISTGQMPGGAGKRITFEVQTGKWSGYGND